MISKDRLSTILNLPSSFHPIHFNRVNEIEHTPEGNKKIYERNEKKKWTKSVRFHENKSQNDVYPLLNDVKSTSERFWIKSQSSAPNQRLRQKHRAFVEVRRSYHLSLSLSRPWHRAASLVGINNEPKKYKYRKLKLQTCQISKTIDFIERICELTEAIEYQWARCYSNPGHFSFRRNSIYAVSLVFSIKRHNCLCHIGQFIVSTLTWVHMHINGAMKLPHVWLVVCNYCLMLNCS